MHNQFYNHCHPPSPRGSLYCAPSAHTFLHLPHTCIWKCRGSFCITDRPPPGSRFPLTFPLHISVAHALEYSLPASVAYNDAHKSVTEDLSASRLCKYNTTWKQWDTFYSWLSILTDLKGIQYPIPFLTDISSQGPYSRPGRQAQTLSQAKHGAIYPLRGGNIHGRGSP